MKEISLKVLLLGGLFFSMNSKTMSATLYSDAFIYKISDQVYSLKDLEAVANNLIALKCYYQDSLLIKVFEDVYQLGKQKELFEIKDYTKVAYSPKQKELFKKLLQFHKLKYYSDSHKVTVQKSIIKAFYMASRQLKCPQSIFEETSSFSPEFNNIMKVEIFLRSRYLPEEKNGKNTNADVTQAVLGIKTLLNSVDKQITEETYW